MLVDTRFNRCWPYWLLIRQLWKSQCYYYYLLLNVFIDYYIIFNASIRYASKTIQLTIKYILQYAKCHWNINSISEPLMHLAKRTLIILPQKIWNQCQIHVECNQWVCIENQLSGFYFTNTLTGNELSITNQEVHGFSNSFQLIKK